MRYRQRQEWLGTIVSSSGKIYNEKVYFVVSRKKDQPSTSNP